MVDKKEKVEKGRKKNESATDAEPGLDAGYLTGYETDGASTRTKLKKKKSKVKLRKASGGDGYETDDGGNGQPPLRKSKSKSRFFKLGNRSKHSIDEDEVPRVPAQLTSPPPPLPAPAFRLPIAAKFATTLKLDSENAILEPPIGPLGSSRAQSPTIPFISPSLPSTESTTILYQTNDSNQGIEPTTGVPEPSLSTVASPVSTSPTKRTIIRFAASDSSDNHTTNSSNGHSFLSRLTNSSSSSASTTGSVSSPNVKSMNISYPLTRSPSPPSPPVDPQPMVVAPPPTLDRSNTKRAPRPLFLNRIPSRQKLGSKSTPNSSDSSPLDWSPAGSPFVVVTPNPSSRPGMTSTSSGSTNSANTVTRLHIPSPLPLRAHEISSPVSSSRNVISSTDFVVPSPSNEVFVPPNSLGHYDIPLPSPPPTVPLPEVPAEPKQQVRDSDNELQQQQRLAVQPPSRSTSPSNSTQRGRVSPFPTRPVQSSGVAALHPSPSRGFESRVRVTRYRDIYAMPPPAGGWKNNFSKEDSGYASSPETSRSTSRRHARQSTKVGIHVEQPSDSEDDIVSDEDLRNVVRGFTDGGRSASATGHERATEPEAALDRRRSLEALQNYYYNSIDVRRARFKSPSPIREKSPRPSITITPSASTSEDDLSDDKSRYTSDDKHSIYKMANPSQAKSLASGWADDNRWSMSVDGESRASFMDADKSDEARERFIRRIEAMFDENGRELPPNLGIGRNAIIPPVPKIPRGLQGSSSTTWI
ncbi:hypothetical protein F5878DRAFT_610625 [Lentinula raphanica]|uniref:Uncharacterized protein n=1 Tax=Lentinula raphanica TaxID=153919 RepID=A0AA38UH53_9AGAR|nr:hypothetical protein F5878DRAFT_610625 [Lentinula raphanica]